MKKWITGCCLVLATVSQGATVTYNFNLNNFSASIAGRAAFVAHIVLATIAPVDIAGNVAALVTRGSVPVFQGDERRADVVVRQYGIDQHEEVADSPRRQCGRYGSSRIAGAQPFITDVRMRDGVITAGWVWVQGHYAV